MPEAYTICQCGFPLLCKVWSFLVGIAGSLSLHIHSVTSFDRSEEEELEFPKTYHRLYYI